MNPAVATRSFFEVTQAFINEDVPGPEKRARYHLCLLSAFEDQDRDLRPRTFAERVIDAADRPALLKRLVESKVAPDTAFVKDTSLIAPVSGRGIGQYRHMGRGSGQLPQRRDIDPDEVYIRLGGNPSARGRCANSPISASDLEQLREHSTGLIRSLLPGYRVDDGLLPLTPALARTYDAPASAIIKRLDVFTREHRDHLIATFMRLDHARTSVGGVSPETLMVLERLRDAPYRLSVGWPQEVPRDALEGIALHFGTPLDPATRRDSSG